MLVLLIRKFEKIPPPHKKLPCLCTCISLSVTLHITCIARQSDENNHVCLSPSSSHVSIARYNICQMYSMCVSPCIHVHEPHALPGMSDVCVSVCHHVHHTHYQTCQMHMCLSTCIPQSHAYPDMPDYVCDLYLVYHMHGQTCQMYVCVSPCIPHV